MVQNFSNPKINPKLTKDFYNVAKKCYSRQKHLFNWLLVGYLISLSRNNFWTLPTTF